MAIDYFFRNNINKEVFIFFLKYDTIRETHFYTLTNIFKSAILLLDKSIVRVQRGWYLCLI